MSKYDTADFDQWFKFGFDKGWVSDVFCNTHDGGYSVMTEEEAAEWEEGGDPCMFVVRMNELD